MTGNGVDLQKTNIRADKGFVTVEISLNEERCGDTYRPHLVPVEFPHLYLGVQFDSLATKHPTKEKFIAAARLIYDGVDYSTLINGTEFLIKEGSRTVGGGKVIDVNGHDFSGYPIFNEYLRYKLSGDRKRAIEKLRCLSESVSKDGALLSFGVYLCRVLDILQYKQYEFHTVHLGHWFNEALKKLLYDCFILQLKEKDCAFEYKKWYCLYARDFKTDKDGNTALCKQILTECGYKDKALVSYYADNRIWKLSFAIHELPHGYLGDPEKDLETVAELKQMLKIYYGEDKRADALSDIEKTIKTYMKRVKK